MDYHHVTLPTGLWVDGVCHREAVLRPPTGYDEERAGSPTEAVHAAQVTDLLAGCLVQLGGYAPVDPAVVAALCVGDREALLLHLRRSLSGENLASSLRCGNEACGNEMDMELTVSLLLQPPYEDNSPQFAVEQDGRLLRLRLPTGADQEAVAQLAATDPEAAGVELARRCILSVQENGMAVEIDGVTNDDLAAVNEALLERDPQAEARLDGACPDCGETTTVLFEAGTFLLQEIRDRHKNLLWEIHHLALHYHWDEQALLAMTSTRRRTYLSMLEATVGGP